MSAPLLRVRDLQVEFPLAAASLRAVDGASFDVDAGEALGLVGESGSGKTMTLRALVGLLPRTARIAGGSVEFEGEDLLRADEDAAARRCAARSIAMIFQEPMTALNPVMRVGEQIAEGPLRPARLRQAARARARRRADAPRRHPRSGAARERLPARAVGRACASA